jgi:YD repeat-containing protein
VTQARRRAGLRARIAYDALNHATQTIAPDGNSSFVEYDAAGLKIRAWTGDLGSVQAQPATNVTASISRH